MELAGHRAVVTGAGGGLGEVIAHALAGKGMHVLVADVDGRAAGRVSGEVEGSAVSVDLSRPGGVDAVIAAVGGQIDVLVNCAGGWGPTGRQYPDAPAQEWDAVLTLNLRSPMRLTQDLLDPLSRAPSARSSRSHPAQDW